VSSVQFLTFAYAGQTPVAVGTDFPPPAAEVRLSDEQRQALTEDLAS
jgi:hypothetical protein